MQRPLSVKLHLYQAVAKSFVFVASLSATEHETEEAGRLTHTCFKTPLWRAVLKLDTDDMLRPASRH